MNTSAIAQPVPAAPHREAPAVRRLMWAWPLAILVGFPIGGLVANTIVGEIDSVSSALAGGLIAGAVIGAAEWLALRPLVRWFWIAATSAGMAVGLVAGAALVDYGISRGDLALMGALHRRRRRRATGARARITHLAPRALVGGREPARLGPRLARHLLRHHKKRHGASPKLRRQRVARIRAADLAAPHIAVPSHGVRGAHNLSINRRLNGGGLSRDTCPG